MLFDLYIYTYEYMPVLKCLENCLQRYALQSNGYDRQGFWLLLSLRSNPLVDGCFSNKNVLRRLPLGKVSIGLLHFYMHASKDIV